MNLDDLRLDRSGNQGWEDRITISDLKELLANLTPEEMEELGEVHESIETSPIDGHVPVSNPGTYLVVKL